MLHNWVIQHLYIFSTSSFFFSCYTHCSRNWGDVSVKTPQLHQSLCTRISNSINLMVIVLLRWSNSKENGKKRYYNCQPMMMMMMKMLNMDKKKILQFTIDIQCSRYRLIGFSYHPICAIPLTRVESTLNKIEKYLKGKKRQIRTHRVVQQIISSIRMTMNIVTNAIHSIV